MPVAAAHLLHQAAVVGGLDPRRLRHRRSCGDGRKVGYGSNGDCADRQFREHV
jgi:hypothetical protein